MPKSVYLAGNIDFVSFEQACDWRSKAQKQLEVAGFIVLNPMVKYKSEEDVSNYHYSEIFIDDLDMVDQADIMLVNFTDEGGFGTPFELGYFYGVRYERYERSSTWYLDLVFGCVGNKYKNHPFVLGVFDKQFDSIDEAVNHIINNVKP